MLLWYLKTFLLYSLTFRLKIQRERVEYIQLIWIAVKIIDNNHGVIISQWGNDIVSTFPAKWSGICMCIRIGWIGLGSIPWCKFRIIIIFFFCFNFVIHKRQTQKFKNINNKRRSKQFTYINIWYRIMSSNRINI